LESGNGVAGIFFDTRVKQREEVMSSPFIQNVIPKFQETFTEEILLLLPLFKLHHLLKLKHSLILKGVGKTMFQKWSHQYASETPQKIFFLFLCHCTTISKSVLQQPCAPFDGGHFHCCDSTS
jgi:hypothetical protein